METAFRARGPKFDAMSDTASTDRPDTRWMKSSHADWPEPVVRTLPYVEIRLEHPGLEPTSYGESFFPDAVPYAVDGTRRVFYWRPTLDAAPGEQPAAGACATTDSLSVLPAREAQPPALVARRDEGTEVVVSGTVAGDSTTALVDSYAVPDVRIRALSESRLELLADGAEHRLQTGTRRRISLSERTVDRVDDGGRTATVTPELAVRFPGERELHHPAPGGTYRLFPSFGLDLDAVADPVRVPTANGELDHVSLAGALGVDLSTRPYPERVLWQAFAYTAFDPHAETVPRLAQFPTGHIALRTD